jgi:hypothetical protein
MKRFIEHSLAKWSGTVVDKTQSTLVFYDSSRYKRKFTSNTPYILYNGVSLTYRSYYYESKYESTRSEDGHRGVRFYGMHYVTNKSVDIKN